VRASKVQAHGFCRWLFLAVGVSLWLAGIPAGFAGQILFVTGSQSDYVIVRDAKAPAPEVFAAEELQKYLHLVSGAKLAIVDRAPGKRAIWVGRAATGAGRLAGRPPDSYLIRIAGGQIHLVGDSPRATLFSVYHFLEKYLGCGWVFPGDDHIPQSPDISVPEGVEDLESPAFSYRAISLFPYTDLQIHLASKAWVNALFPFPLMQVTKDRIDWAAKNRLNYVHPCPNEAGPELWEKVKSRQEIVPEIVKRGLGLHYGGHTYFAWLPPEKYLKDHPEYYAATTSAPAAVGSSAEGRKPESLNWANPEVARVMAENMAKFLDQNPEISIITVWMNDAPATCSTPECLVMEGPLRLSLSHPPGSHPLIVSFSNSAVKFANEVARHLKKSHPNVVINHLAYSELIDAPTNVVPDENVLVCFAPIQRAPFRIGSAAGYFRPLNDDQHAANRAHLTEIRKWMATTKNFYIWDYYSLWWIMGSARPRWHFPILETIESDLRFYRDGLGLTRVSSEIADWHEENMYVYARLAWNPDLSWRQVLEDFCQRSYGPAAQIMLKHWQVLESAKENWLRHREECNRYLQDALREAETQQVRNRINRIARLWRESECQEEGDPVGPCRD
jgi:hypothetical protein